MKRLIIISGEILFVLQFVFICSCKEKPAPPVLTTTAVTAISYTTATSGGTVTDDGGEAIVSRGVCYGTSASPTISNSKTTESSGLGAFTSNITQLTQNTMYYVRAYATNMAGTGYGNQVSFITSKVEIAVLTTTAITAITQTTAVSGGNITDDKGSSVTARGVCWGTATNPTTVNNKTSDATGTGSFVSIMNGLLPGTTYYVRSYAINSIGTSYGNEISFTTNAAIVPVLTTTSVSSITETSATSGGNITSDGGAVVTVRGVCWATTINPTTKNSKTTDGTGTGSFVTNLSGLQPGTIYYIRSYATNSVGTSYGNEISFSTIEGVVTSIQITNIPDSLVVSKKVILNTLVTYETGDPAQNPQLVWSSGNPQIATVSSTGEVLGISRGTTKIIASYNNYVKEIEIKVTPIEITIIDSYLSTPANGYIAEIPVVIFRFLPTKDGKSIDVAKATDFWSIGEISLEDLKSNINNYDKRIKYSLEEGSRFRGYKNIDSNPYLGYKVIAYFTVYDQMPISKDFVFENIRGYDIHQPDFFKIFAQFNVKDYVENKGVKEIWIWGGSAATPDYPSYNSAMHKPENMVTMPESNMSSPTTGNISNSRRFNDMPVYNKTYVVYGYNFRRTQAEAVHNHGHQLESMLKHVNGQQDLNLTLFLQKFCGWGDNNYTKPPLGRAGDCHHPPNTTKDYDYLNTTLVDSDIEDWKPDGGTKKAVNVDTWGKLTYNWPGAADFNQRVESQWYIYWMQNMPGYNNNILYTTGKKITNWWIFTKDWDASIKANNGLHE